MVAMATMVTRMSASYKSTGLSTHVGYTYFLFLVLQLLHKATQRGDATFPSESNTALLRPLLTVKIGHLHNTATWSENTSTLKISFLVFSKVHTPQTAFTAFFPQHIFLMYLTIPRLIDPMGSMLSPYPCPFAFPRLVFHLKTR